MATFVSTSGRQFEEKVWGSESENPKFGFIQPTHHYHAYYLQQINQAQQTPSRLKIRSVFQSITYFFI